MFLLLHHLHKANYTENTGIIKNIHSNYIYIQKDNKKKSHLLDLLKYNNYKK